MALEESFDEVRTIDGGDSGSPTPASSPAPAPVHDALAEPPNPYSFNENEFADLEPKATEIPAVVAPVAPVIETPAPVEEVKAEEVKTDEVKAEEVAPLAPRPHDVFAPLFEPVEGATPQEQLTNHVNKTRDSIKQLKGYDNAAHNALLNATYFENKTDIATWVLEDLGIPFEKVEKVVAWAKSGADLQQLPQPPAFPTPDEFGIVVVNGREYDLNDPDQKELYEDKKYIYEEKIERQQRAIADAKREADDAKRQQDAAARERQTLIQGRENTFLTGQMKFLDDSFTAALTDPTTNAKFNFGEGMEWKEEAARAYLDVVLDKDKDLTRLIGQAIPLVRDGSARASEIAAQMNAIVKAHAERVTKLFKVEAARTSQAMAAAMAGKPKVPAAVAPITVGTNIPAPKAPASYADAQKSLMEELDALLPNR